MKTLKVTDSHLGYFETASGKIVDLRNPKPGDIDVYDIATALSNIVRFNGHIVLPYTVAHHSVIMSCMVPKSLALHALFHDATEAYLGDVISPLKKILGKPYTDLEKKWETVIYNHFGIDPKPAHVVIIKEYDRIMIENEHRALRKEINGQWFTFTDNGTTWELPYNMYDQLREYDPTMTAKAFMTRLKEIITQ